MNPAQEVLYDVPWQIQRLRVIKGWDTEAGTRTNISLLLAYIGRAEGRYWKFVRVWRCRNMVNYALRVAEKHENAVGIKLIKTFQKGLEIEYDRHKGSVVGPLFKPWNWKKVEIALNVLYIQDVELFKQLQAYSEGRLYQGGKQFPTDTAATPELAKFVRLMRDVRFDNG